MTVTCDTPLGEFPGVGQVRGKKLEQLGLVRAQDLLCYYPRAYEDRTQIYEIRSAPLGQRVCIQAVAAEHPRRALIRKGMELVQLKAADGSGILHLTFFNQGYVQKILRAGEEYIFCGVVEAQNNRLTMANPIFERLGKQTMTGRIIPIYHLTAGIGNHFLLSLTLRALDCAASLPETLPPRVRQDHNLTDLEFAIRSIHFPQSPQDLDAARHRLAFEELFFLSVGLAYLKHRRSAESGLALPGAGAQEFQLPFAPTGAQRRVMDEVAADLSSGCPMNRLVQGDVGSGKTVIAAYGAWLAARNHAQAAMMAPTEILAEQHYRTLSALLAPAGVRLGLLTGSLSAPEKRRIKSALANGTIDLVVGTHALISQSVEFFRLALVITDEQHRFGVDQRARLAEKSQQGIQAPPHVLVMSATPIPRTLALMIYGDLEVSVIDELPPGRTPVETYLVREDKRQRMYQFVERLVLQGRQAYIVCPAVDDHAENSETALDLKAVTAFSKELDETVFPAFSVGFLHGKMRPKEKEETMLRFSRGEIQILVSTTVIEVGVDVPNAAIIIVENAERFGLSQLHQLRGRVGRGGHQSYCILVTSTQNPDTMLRLRTLTATTDGFKISEEDLKLRGPGDFFGNRQHGLPQLRLADLAGDMRQLMQAQQAAQTLLSEDPQLENPSHAAVRRRVRQLFADTHDMLN